MQIQSEALPAATARPLRCANYLSPLLQETYMEIAQALGAAIGRAATLCCGDSPTEFQHDLVDLGFICGLLYTHTTRWPDMPLEPLAAPVLRGARYERWPARPLYFSDLIVRRDSPFTTFEELAGCTWACNETTSHSGYNLVYDSLLSRGKEWPYFGEMRHSGSHIESVRMVLDGRAQVAAIDSQVLAVLRHRDAQVAQGTRTVEMLGPSSSPPIVVARGLADELKQTLQTTLLSLHEQPRTMLALHKGGIERFVAVTDSDYDDIRAMYRRVQAHDLATKKAGQRSTGNV